MKVLIHKSRNQPGASGYMIAACPDFKIDRDTLSVTAETTKIQPEELAAFFLHAARALNKVTVCALLGFGWLYWDRLLLASLRKKSSTAKTRSEKLSTADQKEPAAIFLESMRNPQAQKIKAQVQREEKEWLQKQEDLQAYQEKFLLSGDLLDNPKCHAIYSRLSQYCTTREGETLATILQSKATKFKQEHLGAVLERTDLECSFQHTPKESPDDMANRYCLEYFYFELAAFLHLAQTYPVILSNHVDQSLRTMLERGVKFAKSALPESSKLVFRAERIEFPADESPSTSPASSNDDSPRRAEDSDSDPENDLRLRLRLMEEALADAKASHSGKMNIIQALVPRDPKSSPESPTRSLSTKSRRHSDENRSSSPVPAFAKRTSSAPELTYTQIPAQITPGVGMWSNGFAVGASVVGGVVALAAVTTQFMR